MTCKWRRTFQEFLKTERLTGDVPDLLNYGYSQSPGKIYIYPVQKHINN